MSQAILNPICRGLVGYISYLSSCSAYQAYSEYVLYEPILRIAQSKGYSVKAEFPVSKGDLGDAKRVDFDLLHKDKGSRVAIEVKWLKRKTRDFSNDINKLKAHAKTKNSMGFLLLFGPGDLIEATKIVGAQGSGEVVRWDAGKTDYAARWFRIV